MSARYFDEFIEFPDGVRNPADVSSWTEAGVASAIARIDAELRQPDRIVGVKLTGTYTMAELPRGIHVILEATTIDDPFGNSPVTR